MARIRAQAFGAIRHQPRDTALPASAWAIGRQKRLATIIAHRIALGRAFGLGLFFQRREQHVIAVARLELHFLAEIRQRNAPVSLSGIAVDGAGLVAIVAQQPLDARQLRR